MKTVASRSAKKKLVPRNQLQRKSTARAGVFRPIDLDELLDAAAAAEWLRMSKPTLLALVRKNKIPVMRLNKRVLRFHPRTILAKSIKA